MRERTESEQRLLDRHVAAQVVLDNFDAFAAFGAELRRARLEAGLSQKQIEQLSGVDQADISRTEKGLQGRDPNLSVLRRIARAAGLQVVIGLRRIDQPKEQPINLVEL